MRMPRVLILGGTGEAQTLARALQGRAETISSLAGRTRSPAVPVGAVRVGGFGGVCGLLRYLVANRIDRLVDATHPFAAQMSRHARLAAAAADVPRLTLGRPMWRREPGDRWVGVSDATEAATVLRAMEGPVLLTVGPGDHAAFAELPHRMVVRRVESGEAPPFRDHAVEVARGPFDLAGERRLFDRHGIRVLVTKASGGRATEAKMVVARERGLAVVMIRRPPPEPGPCVTEIRDAVEWVLGDAPSSVGTVPS